MKSGQLRFIHYTRLRNQTNVYLQVNNLLLDHWFWRASRIQRRADYIIPLVCAQSSWEHWRETRGRRDVRQIVHHLMRWDTPCTCIVPVNNTTINWEYSELSNSRNHFYFHSRNSEDMYSIKKNFIYELLMKTKWILILTRGIFSTFIKQIRTLSNPKTLTND